MIVNVEPSHLHEVVRPLHLGHEVLHYLFSDHRVGGRTGSDLVHSNGWLWSHLWRGLVLEGIHHLFNRHGTETLEKELTDIPGAMED